MTNPRRRPNVVFVLTDDQGYGDLSCHGNPFLKTPNIDKLHSESVRFTDFHVGTTCAPTRSGLLTGHYCNSAGVWHTIGGRSLLRENEWTLANSLSEAGYRTGHFGKWHLGDNAPFRPHDRGFQETIYHAGGAIGNTGDAWGNDYFDDTYFVNGRPQTFEGYCTDVFFQKAEEFIVAHADVPFFCYIATNAPHGPLNIEPRYSDPYLDATGHEGRARFFGMIANIDENLGRLRARLEDLGLADDTIIVFMTDNGSWDGVELDENEFPLDINGSFSAGMRGRKSSPYEGGHRVPFFLSYPAGRLPAGDLRAGQDVNELTSYVDFMPTILSLCSVEVPEERTFHGESLEPLIRGDSSAHWAERIAVSDTQRIARPMKWRRSCVMRERWRLVNGTELYDLSTDPTERIDVSADHAEVVESLRAGYDEWWNLVSGQFDADIPIGLGIDREPVKLSAHDIRNEACDTAFSQRQVRAGKVVSGYWEVDVREAGEYTVELRRWPAEAGHALTAGIDGDDVEWRRDCIPETAWSHYTGGVALPIRWAQLTIGGENCHAEVAPESRGALFTVTLELGRDHLYASFHDTAERTIAPYYVYVTLIR